MFGTIFIIGFVLFVLHGIFATIPEILNQECQQQYGHDFPRSIFVMSHVVFGAIWPVAISLIIVPFLTTKE